MKTFSEFQEEIKKKMPPLELGGGGGGTDSIMSTSNAKSFKKRVGDVAKVLTFPFHKRRKDPTEKFATEGVAALALKGGSKVVPALMTGIGAVGTIMQARRIKKKRKIGAMEKRLMDREKGDRSNDMIVARRGEADKQNKLIDKYEKKYISQQQKNTRRNIIRGLKGGNIQDEFSAPTNSMGGGAIAGSVEAGDNPPVNKRKKKGEPTIMARGLLPGARTRFKTGADLFTRIKKNKYS